MYDEVKEDDFGSTSSSKNADHKEQFVRASVEEGMETAVGSQPL